jgi:hypothetical protein
MYGYLRMEMRGNEAKNANVLIGVAKISGPVSKMRRYFDAGKQEDRTP